MKIERCIILLFVALFLEIIILNGKPKVLEIEVPKVVASSNTVEIKEIVYDNMTLEELSLKLESNLNSTLKGYGSLFASYSLEVGVDPYLALAITLHETGCKWECSQLVKKCNNVGGQKGGPTCNGGAYKSYNTLEEGIKGYIDNLYNGYVSKGLLTPEQMGKKYAGSPVWPTKINNYLEKIKSNE